MAVIRLFFWVLLLGLFLEISAAAQTTVEIVGNYLLQDGYGGKQVYDGSGNQHLILYEPVFFLETQLAEDTNFHLDALLDTFTSASAKAFDSSTGASGGAVGGGGGVGGGANSARLRAADDDGGEDEGGVPAAKPDVYETRQAVDLGLAQKLGAWTISPSGGYSYEVGYVSLHGGLNLTSSWAEDNFVVSAGGFYYGDSAEIFDLTLKRFTDWIPRITRSYNLSASQILGPMDLVLVGTSFTRQTGLLSVNRKTVGLPTGRVAEVLPDVRDKWTGTLRYIHGFSDTLAFHGDYRFYTDTWGIVAHTLEPALAWETEDELDMLRVAYRYYRQQGTRYYSDAFAAPAAYMTQDSDLAPLVANEGRLQYTHRIELEGGFLQSLDLGGTLLYYVRSNDLHAWVVQAGVGGVF